MKKHILATGLGLATMLAVSSSFGQGTINFQSSDFGGTLNAPVTYAVTANGGGLAGTAGVGVGKEFTASLLFSLNGGSSFSLLTAAQSGDPGYPTSFAFGVGNDGDPVNFAGYFFGDAVTIPGYTSGPVSFQVQAWAGGPSYLAATQWRGQSTVFVEPSLATGTTPPNNFTGLTGFQVNPVPEPTVFALAGLGAAALMIVRRKK